MATNVAAETEDTDDGEAVMIDEDKKWTRRRRVEFIKVLTRSDLAELNHNLAAFGVPGQPGHLTARNLDRRTRRSNSVLDAHLRSSPKHCDREVSQLSSRWQYAILWGIMH